VCILSVFLANVYHDAQNREGKKKKVLKWGKHIAIYTLLIQKCMHMCTHACMHAGKQAVWSSNIYIYTSKGEK